MGIVYLAEQETPIRRRYAPELNPDEFVWTHFKRSLANGRPDNVNELLTTLCRLTKKVRRRPALIRSFVTASDLPAFL